MRRRPRPITAEEKRQMWARWKQGSSCAEIAGLLDRRRSTVWNVLSETGGVQPRQPKRAASHLSTTEREEISRGLAAGLKNSEIARLLGRPRCTVGREIARNGGRQAYRAEAAEQRRVEQARRPKICLLARNEPLRQIVAEKLRQLWSPEQIAGWTKAEHHNDRCMQISHETIYRSLFIQARGVLKKELMDHLRTGRSMRKGKTSSAKGHGHGQIVGAVSIRQRPAQAEDRAVPGHWEGDLIAGGRNSFIATLVERHTRYAVLVRVAGKDSDSVVSALIRQAHKLPDGLMKTLTWDRGQELAQHKRFTIDTDVQVYFCDPSSPWQRGSNENTNGLLRQYFPKGMDLSPLTQEQLDEVARSLNTRPRKTLGFATPADKLAALVLR